MTDITPLQVHPWPMGDERFERLREAKASLGLELKVLPTEAVPGLHARVLAFESLPPWVCDAALVPDDRDVAQMARALDWVLTAPPDDTRGFMATDWLGAVLGGEVKDLGYLQCKCECGNPLRPEREGRCDTCYHSGCHLAGGMCLRD